MLFNIMKYFIKQKIIIVYVLYIQKYDINRQILYII